MLLQQFQKSAIKIIANKNASKSCISTCKILSPIFLMNFNEVWFVFVVLTAGKSLSLLLLWLVSYEDGIP